MFDQVLRRIGLAEKDKDYFGMEYEDDQKVSVCQFMICTYGLQLEKSLKHS